MLAKRESDKWERDRKKREKVEAYQKREREEAAAKAEAERAAAEAAAKAAEDAADARKVRAREKKAMQKERSRFRVVCADLGMFPVSFVRESIACSSLTNSFLYGEVT